jgi:hypothetical protein
VSLPKLVLAFLSGVCGVNWFWGRGNGVNVRSGGVWWEGAKWMGGLGRKERWVT